VEQALLDLDRGEGLVSNMTSRGDDARTVTHGCSARSGSGDAEDVDVT